MNEILATYKYYDSKGRRLSIFAEQTPDGQLEVFVLTCSKKDNFSKKFAREIYQSFRSGVLNTDNILIHPTIEKISVLDNKTKYSFIKYCKLNFYKKFDKLVLVETIKPIFVKQNVFALNKAV